MNGTIIFFSGFKKLFFFFLNIPEIKYWALQFIFEVILILVLATFEWYWINEGPGKCLKLIFLSFVWLGACLTCFLLHKVLIRIIFFFLFFKNLAFVNAEAADRCDAISCILRNVLDCYHYPRINESLVVTILYLLNHPNTRHYIKHNTDLEVRLEENFIFNTKFTFDLIWGNKQYEGILSLFSLLYLQFDWGCPRYRLNSTTTVLLGEWLWH